MFSADSVTQLKTLPQKLCVHHILEAWAERTPEGIAIAAPGRSPLRYARLLTHIKNVVETLNAMGVGRNDRVAIVLPNGPEMAVAFLAIATGATSAPLNPSYLANEFDFYLSDLRAKALIVQSGVDSQAISVARERNIPVIELSPIMEAEAGIFTLTGHKRPRAVLGGFARADDVSLVLHTSGTTARPKIVPLTQANICTSARNISVALELGDSDRCLSVMPLFHIHGLMVTLSSLLAGGSVCAGHFEPQSFFRCMDDFAPTWYTAVPTVHQAILRMAGANQQVIARRPLRFIRSSSSPLLPKVMAELEDMFNAPVIESYGMTEASHQITSNPLPPRKRKAGSVGVAAGCEVAVMDEGGSLLPKGKTGEIVIRGANVMLGYEHNQEFNKSAFTSGWFHTGDEGFLDHEGYLFITGRLKEIINRGGEKIAPREVDEVLMSHPAVAQAVTFAVPHINLGEDVAAAIVLRANASATVREIQEFAARRLAEFKVPHRVVIVDEIPKGPTGKMQRIGLAEKLGLAATNQRVREAKACYIAPRTPLEEKLTKIWAETLGLERVSIRDNFFDLGGYSLLAMQLFEGIEKITGKRLPPTTLLQAPTIEQLANILRQDGRSATWSSLVAIQPNGSKPPFFCVHPVGGSVLWYYDLARHLDPDQPFYGLQAQGLDGKHPLHTRVEEMAAHYVKEIAILQPQGPYFLGGLSFGGLVAFEMARQLHAQGQEVALLALFDTRGPGYPKLLSNTAVSPNKISRLSDRISRHLNALSSLGAREKLVYVYMRVVYAAKSVKEETKWKVKRIIRRVAYKSYLAIGRPSPHTLGDLKEFHRQVMKSYVPQIYPDRVILFRGREQPDEIYPDPTLGWDELAAGGLEIHEVPGDHNTIIREPLVRVLAEKLRPCLGKSRVTVSGNAH